MPNIWLKHSGISFIFTQLGSKQKMLQINNMELGTTPQKVTAG